MEPFAWLNSFGRIFKLNKAVSYSLRV
jgi:hypothetical protein